MREGIGMITALALLGLAGAAIAEEASGTPAEQSTPPTRTTRPSRSMMAPPTVRIAKTQPPGHKPTQRSCRQIGEKPADV